MEWDEAYNWKQHIVKLADQYGFSAVGLTSGAPLEGLMEYLEERSQLEYQVSFEEKEVHKRVNPQALWPLCKTVVALAYPLPFSAKPGDGEGLLARSAVGEDYHTLVKGALHNVVEGLMEAGWPGKKPLTQVDTGPLNERAFAKRAGLGWIGKNHQLIIPGVGSFVALALLLLDQTLPTDGPLLNQCGECSRCINACPAKILGSKHFQANQCLSYLTQSKEPLDRAQQISLGNRIFGCDTCQETCPHNSAFLIKEEALEKKRTQLLSRGVHLWDTLNLTKGQFNSQWKQSAAGWRGKSLLQRNAYLALQNVEDPRLNKWAEESQKVKAPALIHPYLDNTT